MTDLSQACDDLTQWLPHAKVLLAQPDTAPTTGRSKPGSQPPWNTAVANALFDALEGIRDIEHTMRGRDRRPHAQAGKTIASIVRLAHALPASEQQDVTGQLTRYTVTILQLAAIDQEETPRKIDGASCPYCQFPMLRVYPRSGRVTCLRHGVCFDSRECHPTGVMAVGAASGQPMIAWADGLVQLPPQGDDQ